MISSCCWTPVALDDYANIVTVCMQSRTCVRCDTCTDHCECPDDITREHYLEGGGDA